MDELALAAVMERQDVWIWSKNKLSKYQHVKSKMADRRPQNGRRGLERCLPHFKQLLLNKFFDLSTPSMRKVDNREKKENKNLNTLSPVGT